MAALTLRVLTRAGDTTKGSPLTNSEIDQNFINIDADLDTKAPLASPTFTGSVTIPGGTINATSIGATTRSTGAFTSLTANNAVTFTQGTASTTTTTGTLVVTGGVGVSGQVTSGSVSTGSAEVSGNTSLTTFTQATQSITSTGSVTCNLSVADVFIITLNANTTVTFTNPPANGTLKQILVVLIQGTGGSRTCTFTNARYTDGVVPVLSTAVGAKDVLSFFTYDAGANYFAGMVMADAK